MSKQGFTLAEVLITLGVIGVVAAITLPTLIQNYQKTVWVNQLKKSVNVIENGVKLAMAHDEVMNLSNTDLFKFSEDGLNKFMNEFKKYFNVIKYENGQNFDNCYKLHYRKLNGEYIEEGEGDIRHSIWLSDGTILFHDFYSEGGDVKIDVNGEKGPNQFGRDRFFFYLTNEGILKPKQGICNPELNYYDNGCAARIIENGWKMDY